MLRIPLASSFARRAVLAVASFSLAFAGFAPLAADAAPAAGDLVKLPDDGNLETTADSAVYYVGSDGKRYAFPNSQAYFTWYADFDGVNIISAAEMAALPLGGNVTYRPGTRLVKITSDPNVYAVEPNGVLRHVTSEAIAIELFGGNWNKRVDDIPDAFFFNYTVGAPLAAPVFPSGSVVKRSSDGAYFRIVDGVKRKLATAEVRAALRVQEAYVLSATGDLSGYETGEDVIDFEPSIGDTSQKNTVKLPETPTLSVVTPSTTFFGVNGDAAFIDVKIASRQAVTLKRITVRLQAGEAANAQDDHDAGGLVNGNNARPNFTQLRFRDKFGVEPFAAQELKLDNALDHVQTFTFTGTYNIPANTEQVLSFIGHTDHLLPTDQSYKATIVRTEVELVGGLTGAPISFLPAGDLVGPMMTSLNESMKLEKGTAAGGKQVVRGATDVDISSITFKATTVAPNVIKSLTVTGYIDEESDGSFLAGIDADNGSETRVMTMVPQVSLFDAANNKLAGPVPVDVNGRAVFGGLHYVIPAGGSANLVVRGSVPSTIDIESKPNRVFFDVLSAAGDVSATDEKGNPVSVIGDSPNGGAKPSQYLTVLKNGTLTISWAGKKDAVLASTETELGTLSVSATGDDYAVPVVSFKLESGVKSLASVKLTCASKDTAGNAVSTDYNGGFVDGIMVLRNLPLKTGTDATSCVMYGKIFPRELGAVSGDVVAVSLDKSNALQFTSVQTGDKYSEADVDNGSFKVESTASSQTVRYTMLYVKGEAASGNGGYRDASVQVLKFTMQAAQTGDVRIRKMTFSLSPSDNSWEEGKMPPTQAMVGWANANGDFNDDDDIVNLWMTGATGNKKLVGEGSDASLKFMAVVGGSRNAAPSKVLPSKGATGITEYSFSKGNELVIHAGSLMTFSFEVDTNVFAPGKDYALGVSLNGGTDFTWSDTGNLDATQLTGDAADKLPVSGSVSVKY